MQAMDVKELRDLKETNLDNEMDFDNVTDKVLLTIVRDNFGEFDVRLSDLTFYRKDGVYRVVNDKEDRGYVIIYTEDKGLPVAYGIRSEIAGNLWESGYAYDRFIESPTRGIIGFEFWRKDA